MTHLRVCPKYKRKEKIETHLFKGQLDLPRWISHKPLENYSNPDITSILILKHKGGEFIVDVVGKFKTGKKYRSWGTRFKTREATIEQVAKYIAKLI